MNTIVGDLTKLFQDAFNSAGYDKVYGEVVTSDRKELCDYQCNGALKAAKEYKKNPLQIAEDVVKSLNKSDIVTSAVVEKPGFINIVIFDDYLTHHINKMNADEYKGIVQLKEKEKIVVDYGGPNIAKPLHIGHLRAAIIGEAIKRIAKSVGAEVYGDVHLGDWGLQMGLIILELEKRSDIKNLTSDELNEIYPAASKKSKLDEEYREKAKQITAKLQKKDPKYIKIWEEIKKISLKDIKEIYNVLNVSFDFWYGESDAEKYVSKLIDVLNEKKLLKESSGALVVYVKEETDKVEMPPVIIKTQDDSNLYATTDLATIIGRVEEINPDKMWYVVDSRQSLHFEQVFRVSYLGSIVRRDVSLEHLGFGTMNSPDGKPYKTRDGGTMKLVDFYNEVYNKVYEKVKASSVVSSSDAEETAKNIAVATIKFGDLINHRQKDYIFDLDKFLSTEGKTGSFLLYTVARINSILKKTEKNMSIDINKIYNKTQREILLKISSLQSVIYNAYEQKAPNQIAEEAYQLSVLFSKFYNEVHILNESDEEKKSSYISTLVMVKKYLEFLLDLLAIKTVSAM